MQIPNTEPTDARALILEACNIKGLSLLDAWYRYYWAMHDVYRQKLLRMLGEVGHSPRPPRLKRWSTGTWAMASGPNSGRCSLRRDISRSSRPLT